MSEPKVTLGRVLFFDPLLSGNGTRSCGSCHQPEKAFTDGLVKNTVIGDRRMLRRNTPTLINAALQPSQFYDLRVTTLEDQSRTVVQNIEEMHGAMNLSAKRLWNDVRYRELFEKAFPRANRTGIDTLEVMNAIGCYVRSLTQLTSRFDDYMRGSDSALDGDEIAGFNLFMGKAKCATCHYMPLFNGTFPPRFVKTESEVIGVPAAAGSKKIDEDRGRYDVIPVEAYRHAFKTPTLRNVARTSPYMHNGIYSSLKQVVDFYEKGGGVGLGIKLDNQTLPFDKLELTPKEKGELIAFMKSLDSK
jgi:cytochrome c peroxidase